jgi:hypothetical protein
MQDLNDYPAFANLSTFLFHAAVSAVLYNTGSVWVTTFYLFIAISSTILVHYSVFMGCFVRKWPDGNKNETTANRLQVDPILAVCNIFIAKVLMVIALGFEYLGGKFIAIEEVLNRPNSQYYDAIKPLQPDLVKIDQSSMLSDLAYWIFSQLSTVSSFSAVAFTVLSILAILAIEVFLVWCYSLVKDKSFLHVLKGS